MGEDNGQYIYPLFGYKIIICTFDQEGQGDCKMMEKPLFFSPLNNCLSFPYKKAFKIFIKKILKTFKDFATLPLIAFFYNHNVA
jgi:hypothetical protein